MTQHHKKHLFGLLRIIAVKFCLAAWLLTSCCFLSPHTAHAGRESEAINPNTGEKVIDGTIKGTNKRKKTAVKDAYVKKIASDIFRKLAVDKSEQVFQGRIYGFPATSWSFQVKTRPENLTAWLEHNALFDKMTQLGSTWLLQGVLKNFSLLLQIDWHASAYQGVLTIADMGVQPKPDDIPHWLPSDTAVISQIDQDNGVMTLIITSPKSQKALSNQLLSNFKKRGWRQVNSEGEGFLAWQKHRQAVRAYLQAGTSGSGSEGLIVLLTVNE